MTLIVLTRDATWIDPWGREQRDSKYLIDVADVTETGETVAHNNGYEVFKAAVMVDSLTRREWARIPSIDYSGGTSYLYLPGPDEQPDPAYVWWRPYHLTMRLQRSIGTFHLFITNEKQLRSYLS